MLARSRHGDDNAREGVALHWSSLPEHAADAAALAADIIDATQWRQPQLLRVYVGALVDDARDGIADAGRLLLYFVWATHTIFV